MLIAVCLLIGAASAFCINVYGLLAVTGVLTAGAVLHALQAHLGMTHAVVDLLSCIVASHIGYVAGCALRARQAADAGD